MWLSLEVVVLHSRSLLSLSSATLLISPLSHSCVSPLILPVLLLHQEAAIDAVRWGRAVEVTLVAERVGAPMAGTVWFCTANFSQMHVTDLVFVWIL